MTEQNVRQHNGQVGLLLEEAAARVGEADRLLEEVHLIAMEALDYDSPIATERHIKALRKIAEMTALEAD